ncbi:folylpolyglutamate synthase/dihydrofolate synthase family protein [soil metagenome]
MRSIKNFADARAVLGQFVTVTTEPSTYTLDVIKQFLENIGNPQNNLKVLHIAGTSGKTSTAYFAAALLHESGHSVGLTVSPHIDQISERAQIGMKALPEAEYCKELTMFLDLIDKYDAKLSYFELLVAFAYWLFDKHRVEYAVVEVGLGGLLDGTNVVSRQDKVSIITDIGLDHVNILGKTLPEIAYQKAGIIYNDNLVFMNQQPDEVVKVIQRTADKKNAQLFIIDPPDDDLQPSLDLPPFQKRNFGLAISAVHYVLKRDQLDDVNDEQIQIASHIHIPGRMEVTGYQSKTIVLDGSHNEQKISALVNGMKQQFVGKKITLLVSFGSNKIPSVVAGLHLLRELGSSIIITAFDGGQDELRTPIAVDTLADYAKRAGFNQIITERDPAKALNLLCQDKDSIGLVTGSFYLLHQIRDIVFARN